MKKDHPVLAAGVVWKVEALCSLISPQKDGLLASIILLKLSVFKPNCLTHYLRVEKVCSLLGVTQFSVGTFKRKNPKD